MNNVYLLSFAAVAIGIGTKVLHELYLNAGDFKRKTWIMSGIAGLWIAMVLVLACYFCSYAQTVEQCFLLWTIAFGVGCIGAAFQAFILILCRNKRQLSETDKMKLKDI